MANRYICGITHDMGYGREKQEDLGDYRELGDNAIICIMADGTTSVSNYLQPAGIVVNNILDEVESLYKMYSSKGREKAFFENADIILKQAFINAHKVLIAFKSGNEEIYSGYAASVTAALFFDGNRIIIGHSGNTRLYIIRKGKITLMTSDMTKAMTLIEEGLITKEQYYQVPDRLVITGGLGMAGDPKIQIRGGKLKADDIVLLTTDGVHYAIREEAMKDIILEAGNALDSTKAVTDAARTIIKYPDNASALVCFSPEA